MIPARWMTLACLIALPGALCAPGIPAAAAAPATEQAMTATAKPRDVDTHHLFTPPADRKTWEARARELREQVLFSAGLYPLPEKTPLHPRVTGRIEGPDYIIENVAIETLPGFYLCGNLYRPKGGSGPFPAIVNPHGHWSQGRLTRQPDVPKAEPAPAKPAPGMGDLVAIGINLARQGFVVFAYDMVGYNDTDQADHKFAGDLDSWLNGVSLMGLQLWDSIRAVDYVSSLPDVDHSRIGATGASGGGTQTFLLCAVDERVKAAVPVNMVSAYMQGGCLCENGPGLRVGTDNPEVAAMFAPKPLLLVSATGDWTAHVPQEEGPAIRKVYDLYGAGDRLAVEQFNYEHNYNIESREAMYAWFGRWLLNDPDAAHFRERPGEVDLHAMRVWTAEKPRPAGALDAAGLKQELIERSDRQLAALWPKDAASLARFRKVAAPALSHSLGISLPSAPARRLPAGGNATALIVAVEGDPQAEQVASALAAKGRETHLLRLAPVAQTPETLWAAFFSCYNRTPAAERVQTIVDETARLEAQGARVDLVGVGPAGLWALLARALRPGGALAADMAGFHPESDADYLARLYAPGLRRAGGVRSAVALCAPGAVSLYNTGGSAAFRPVVSGGSAQAGPLDAQQVADWIVATKR